jgi:hypothetical protein
LNARLVFVIASSRGEMTVNMIHCGDHL